MYSVVVQHHMQDFSIEFFNRALHYHGNSQSNRVFDLSGRVIFGELVENFSFWQ
jgi:hypothetical protein